MTRKELDREFKSILNSNLNFDTKFQAIDALREEFSNQAVSVCYSCRLRDNCCGLMAGICPEGYNALPKMQEETLPLCEA